MLPSSLADLLALYQDPMFWRFPMGSLAVSTGMFLLFALPYTWRAWLLSRPVPLKPRVVIRGLSLPAGVKDSS